MGNRETQATEIRFLVMIRTRHLPRGEAAKLVKEQPEIDHLLHINVQPHDISRFGYLFIGNAQLRTFRRSAANSIDI